MGQEASPLPYNLRCCDVLKLKSKFLSSGEPFTILDGCILVGVEDDVDPVTISVMIYSNAVVPCEDFEGSNVTLGVFIFEILTKMYNVNSELEAISTTFSLNLTYFLSLYQKFDK